MIQVPGAEEIGKTTRSFFDSMREHPVTLALVLTNVLLVGVPILQRRRATCTAAVHDRNDHYLAAGNRPAHGKLRESWR